MLWLVLSIAGAFAFSQLKYALFPDIAFPVVLVQATGPRAEAETTERTITTPIEGRLRGLSGLTRLQSSTYPGIAAIQASFDVGNDLDARKAQVRAALEGLKLPAATGYAITTVDLNESAVATYAVQSPRADLGRIGPYVRDVLAARLRALPGVLKVTVAGDAPGGRSVSAVRYDGAAAVAISVVKNARANTLEVASDAERAVALARADRPDLRIVRAESQATYIREASHATTEALGLAVLLSVVVILPFLMDWRATMIAALAIPTSLLGTALVMRALGFDLETITLLALALVVGVIVDDAIVAVENIVRHIEAGEEPRVAAGSANKEMGRTLVAATLTIVAVFLPIGLMRGTLGQFFKPFGLTASVAVLFSLFVARTLVPAVAACWLRAKSVRACAVDTNGSRSRYPSYARLLRWSLGHRTIVSLGALAAFGIGIGIVPFIPKGFIPHLDRGEFDVAFSAPEGSSLAETERVARRLEEAIRTNPAVESIYATIGTRPEAPNAGLLAVRLRADRRLKTIDAENAVRAALPTSSGTITSVEDVPFVGEAGAKPLQVSLTGKDLGVLRAQAKRLSDRLTPAAGFADLTTAGAASGPGDPIVHLGGLRAVQIEADLTRGLQIGDATDKLVSAARATLGPKVSLHLGGDSSAVVSTFSQFGMTLALAIVAIGAVLVTLFRSWLDPIVIGVALPLSVLGAFLGLWITRAEFGMISLMGVIFLFGLVNKNAILLVDSIKRLRAEGFARGDAIVEAGAQRLRPIVMTTAATILGMLPIALGFGAGAELRSPMAVTIIGGLISSTLLSLVVVPIAYTLVDDLVPSRRRRARADETPPNADASVRPALRTAVSSEG